jgi:hypothetical protein
LINLETELEAQNFVNQDVSVDPKSYYGCLSIATLFGNFAIERTRAGDYASWRQFLATDQLIRGEMPLSGFVD